MLPDVVDDFQVANPDSVGHEAIFYSFYVFFTKFASGVSLGVSTLSLEYVFSLSLAIALAPSLSKKAFKLATLLKHQNDRLH